MQRIAKTRSVWLSPPPFLPTSTQSLYYTISLTHRAPVSWRLPPSLPPPIPPTVAPSQSVPGQARRGGYYMWMATAAVVHTGLAHSLFLYKTFIAIVWSLSLAHRQVVPCCSPFLVCSCTDHLQTTVSVHRRLGPKPRSEVASSMCQFHIVAMKVCFNSLTYSLISGFISFTRCNCISFFIPYLCFQVRRRCVKI